MRVLHINAGNLFGGVETFLLALARGRDLCAGIEPEFALCFEGRLNEELRAAEVPVHHLGPARVSRPWTVWRVRRRLRAVLRAGGYDLVLCHGCWPHAIAAPEARRAGVPFVFWAHGLQSGRHWLERWAACYKPDFVLANSRTTQSCVPKLFPGVRTQVVYLPVSPTCVLDRAATRVQVRTALGTPDRATVILMACRLEPLKGHALLLQALGRLADRPGWECWLAGGPQRPKEERYLSRLQEQCACLGIAERVRFLGQRADVPQLLAAADIHCQPNIGPESFGIALIEAMYAGLPVITTALGGALEIVRDDCGILVSPGDPGKLAAALAELLRDPDRRARLGAAGPGRAATLCDLKTQMNALGQVLTQISACGFALAPCVADAKPQAANRGSYS